MDEIKAHESIVLKAKYYQQVAVIWAAMIKHRGKLVRKIENLRNRHVTGIDESVDETANSEIRTYLESSELKRELLVPSFNDKIEKFTESDKIRNFMTANWASLTNFEYSLMDVKFRLLDNILVMSNSTQEILMGNCKYENFRS